MEVLQRNMKTDRDRITQFSPHLFTSTELYFSHQIFVIFIFFVIFSDSQMSGCPDPRDLSHCLFEALYNDACQRPEEMKIICNDFCNRPC